MASATSNELTSSELSGAILADAFKEQMLEGPESVSQTAVSSAQRVINDFENLILPISNDNSSITTVNETIATPEPNLVATATSVIDALNEFENRLSSVCNQENGSNGTNSSNNVSGNDAATSTQRPSTPTGQLQAQTSNTSDDSKQIRPRRHIMLSYHHDSSFNTCRRIHDALRKRGYKVWMDRNDLHGSIHQGMAEAIDNSFVVLFCMNHEYYTSEFCRKEAMYTDKRHINFIPCLLEKYEPEGWLGIIIRDQMFIDFSKLNDFDVVFEELIGEIQAIEGQSPMSSINTLDSSQESATLEMETTSSFNTDLSFNNGQNQYDSLRAVIREFRESINQSNRDAQPMTEEEFSRFVNYIHRRVFNNTSSPLPQTDNNHFRQVLQEILHHQQNQTEFLRKITEAISSITETRTIVKLFLVFAFVWAINKFL